MAAPAVDDKANRALLALLVRDFGIARSGAVLERGQRGRLKRVRLRRPARLPAWFAALGGIPGEA